MAENQFGNGLEATGSASSDDELLFTTSDISSYEAFMLMSHAGAVDVEVTLDGINWSSAPLSLQDFGASDGNPAIVTTEGRVYGFAGKFRRLRVRQNGVTASEATLLAWSSSD